MSRTWTDEEIQYLESSWGNKSLNAISNHLERTIEAVKLKGYRLGLGDPREHYDGITINQLSYALNTSYSILKNWIKLYNFPAKKRVFSKKSKVLVVKWDDFWKWSEKNKHMLDFSRLEENLLGPEPEWVKVKRDADQIKKRKIKMKPWTKKDDSKLRGMLNAYCYSYTDIARRLNRTEGAVKRRILDLGLKQRPVRRNNHIKYTEEEIAIIKDLYNKGYAIDVIAERLNKSALGVRGKLERIGYKFNNGVAVIDEEAN